MPPDVTSPNISLTVSGSSFNKRIGFIESLLVHSKVWRLLLRQCAFIGFCFAKIAWQFAPHTRDGGCFLEGIL
jgi:hypothetical protein